MCSFISVSQIQIAFLVGVLWIYRLLSARIMPNNDWHTLWFCSLVIMFFCWQDSTLLHIINIWTCARISISPVAMTQFSASCFHCDIKAGRADVQLLTFLSQNQVSLFYFFYFYFFSKPHFVSPCALWCLSDICPEIFIFLFFF